MMEGREKNRQGTPRVCFFALQTTAELTAKHSRAFCSSAMCACLVRESAFASALQLPQAIQALLVIVLQIVAKNPGIKAVSLRTHRTSSAAMCFFFRCVAASTYSGNSPLAKASAESSGWVGGLEGAGLEGPFVSFFEGAAFSV